MVVIENVFQTISNCDKLDKHTDMSIDHSGKFQLPFKKNINDDKDRYKNINEVKIRNGLRCFRHELNLF